jgi:hypothetical protein
MSRLSRSLPCAFTVFLVWWTSNTQGNGVPDVPHVKMGRRVNHMFWDGLAVEVEPVATSCV